MSAPFDKSIHALRQRLLAASLVFVSACAAPVQTPPPPNVPSPAAPSVTPEKTRTLFRHHRSKAVVSLGAPNHRAHDVLAIAGEAAVIDAKLAYGPADKDLVDEDVRIEREGPGAQWIEVGVARTNEQGGIHFGAGTLPLGAHRVRVTVVGDGTSTELACVVVPGGQSVFVSDVDGTLTESESAEFPALLKRKLPPVHPSAAEAFRKLVGRGFVPVYLTARPEWLIPRTRELLATNGFPPGVLITERNHHGRFGTSAALFKISELEPLVKQGRTKLEWAFGNTPSDAEAYSRFVPEAKRRVFYRYTDAIHGGRRIESYDEILSDLSP